MPHPSLTAITQTPCSPLPRCPVCGGLECLCRPRFFAGQMLSEEDLQALDHYIIEKNKLHNRYLHGAGTVCGLQVLCHECQGWVKITSGYAIDPCGNDIIVCQDHSFDLCALIQDCCAKARNRYECEPMASPPLDCQDIERSWFVTLRYRETPSRGISALKSAAPEPCCSRCGSSSGGCGCHGHSHQKQAARPVLKSARAPLPQCEPTRTCEGFVVELAPVPLQVVRPNEPADLAAIYAGTYLGKVIECSKEISAVKALKPINVPPGQELNAFLVYKQTVWDFLNAHHLTRCQLLADVSAITPVLGGPGPAFDALDSKLDQLLHDCLCSALLPPCPPDPADPRVILATVTVKTEAHGCRILNICHQHGRRVVLTSPNVLYWSSIASLIKQVLENACCREPVPPSPNDQMIAMQTDLTKIETLMRVLANVATFPQSPLATLQFSLRDIFTTLGINLP
jgi:hypothetical protein